MFVLWDISIFIIHVKSGFYNPSSLTVKLSLYRKSSLIPLGLVVDEFKNLSKNCLYFLAKGNLIKNNVGFVKIVQLIQKTNSWLKVDKCSQLICSMDLHHLKQTANSPSTVQLAIKSEQFCKGIAECIVALLIMFL